MGEEKEEEEEEEEAEGTRELVGCGIALNLFLEALNSNDMKVTGMPSP